MSGSRSLSSNSAVHDVGDWSRRKFIGAAGAVGLGGGLLAACSGDVRRLRAIACRQNQVAAVASFDGEVHRFELTPAGAIERIGTASFSRDPIGVAFTGAGELFIAS